MIGPDHISVETWRSSGEMAVEVLTRLFNTISPSKRMCEEWRRSILVPVFQNQGGEQSCSSSRGMKLIRHSMKTWERVVKLG